MLSGAVRNVAVPQECSKSLETGLLRGGYEAEGARCCPIGLKEPGQIPSTPEGAEYQGENAGKAVMPSMSEGQEAQEHIDCATPSISASGQRWRCGPGNRPVAWFRRKRLTLPSRV